MPAESDRARPQAHLTAFLSGVGYHESAWRLADPGDLSGPARFGVLERAAQTAERGLLDAFFDVSGALTLPRSPQGRPAFAQAGSSGPGIELAGKTADLVFTAQPDIAAGRRFRDSVREAARRHDRDAGSVLVLPGVAFVIGSTEAEARQPAPSSRTGLTRSSAGATWHRRNSADLPPGRR